MSESDRYISAKFGYCPHIKQVKATCPVCKNGVFESYPQSVPDNAKIWCHEYVCTNCKTILAIEVDRE